VSKILTQIKEHNVGVANRHISEHSDPRADRREKNLSACAFGSQVLHLTRLLDDLKYGPTGWFLS